MPATLKCALAAFPVWWIAVGLIISGDYHDWRPDGAQARTLGFLVTMCLAAAIDLARLVSVAEPTVAVPLTARPFVQGHSELGPFGGAKTGIATLVAILFARPAGTWP